jgi:hypothetical protein
MKRKRALVLARLDQLVSRPAGSSTKNRRDIAAARMGVAPRKAAQARLNTALFSTAILSEMIMNFADTTVGGCL